MIPQVPPPDPASDFGIESRPWRGGMSLAEIVATETPLDIDISEDMEREFSPQRKDTTMAQGSLTTGKSDYNQQTTNARPSIADTLDSAVSALRDATSDLIILTDRLCGAVPDSKGAELRGVADGIFSQIDTSRGDIEAITQAIANSIGRIRGRL